MRSSQGDDSLVGIGLAMQDYQRYLPFLERKACALTHLSFVSVADTTSARMVREKFNLPFIHHLSNVAPADLHGPDFHRLEELNAISEILRAQWCGEDVGSWNVGGYPAPYFLSPPLEADLAGVIGERIAQVMRRSAVPFLAENPPFSAVVGGISLGRFFQILHERSGCEVVLDIPHVYSYLLSTGSSLDEFERDFPLHAVIEAHIAGGVQDGHGRYVDSHCHAVSEVVLELTRSLVPKCPNLRAVTFEVGSTLDLRTANEDLEKIGGCLRMVGFVSGLHRE